MPEQYIYESPKSGHRRSSPVDAGNTARRRILEQAGWRIVETIGADPPTPAEEPVKPARKRAKGPAEEAVEDSTEAAEDSTEAAEEQPEDES